MCCISPATLLKKINSHSYKLKLLFFLKQLEFHPHHFIINTTPITAVLFLIVKQTKKVQGILALFKQHLFEFLFGHEYLNTTQWVQNTSQINIGDFFFY